MQLPEQIGVIGAGVMGQGVALAFALHNIRVVLYDNNSAVLEHSPATMQKQLKEFAFMKPGFQYRAYKDLEIRLVNSIEEFKNCPLLIENITESLPQKKQLHSNLSQLCQRDTFIAINTSCIPITQISAEYKNPENVIGAHFMNPAPIQPLVELIKGYHTSDESIQYMKNLLTLINKKTVLANDSPGFISNRLSHLFMNEAAFLVFENVSDVSSIDKLFREGYHHKMGPLETADLIGLDTVVNSLNILYEQYQDSKFRCCPLLKQMVAAGKLGMKSGEGFYKYA